MPAPSSTAWAAASSSAMNATTPLFPCAVAHSSRLTPLLAIASHRRASSPGWLSSSTVKALIWCPSPPTRLSTAAHPEPNRQAASRYLAPEPPAHGPARRRRHPALEWSSLACPPGCDGCTQITLSGVATTASQRADAGAHIVGSARVLLDLYHSARCRTSTWPMLTVGPCNGLVPGVAIRGTP
jgi:hypothetical protein